MRKLVTALLLSCTASIAHADSERIVFFGATLIGCEEQVFNPPVGTTIDDFVLLSSLVSLNTAVERVGKNFDNALQTVRVDIDEDREANVWRAKLSIGIDYNTNGGDGGVWGCGTRLDDGFRLRWEKNKVDVFMIRKFTE